MKKIKSLVASVLAISMLSGTALSLTACSKNGGAYDYEIWLSGNENASYTDYNDNLAAKYWDSLQYKGEDGEMHDTNVKFYTAASTSAAKDNFNTMMTTQSFYDVMDLAQSSYTASELYTDGMLLDLTPYMEECMPNYLAWLNAHPDYGKTAVDYVNGEKKYLQIYAYQDFEEAWGGWQYRRDWVAKYGKDKDGNAFTYSYDKDGVLTDNIIFPSYHNEALRNSYNALLAKEGKEAWDGTDPVFISDWEWMLDIFKTALKDKGVANGNSQTGETGYPMSIYYPGYIETGDLVSAFGNVSGDFYSDVDGTVKYGLTSDNFKVYLKAINGWYNNGWIDSVFNTRSSDMYYQVDTDKLYTGRIGLFYGNGNTIVNKLAKSGDKFLDGYFCGAARQPINDKYSGATAQYIPGQNEFLPRVFFAQGYEFSSFGLTVKLEQNKKDIHALLRMIDYLYEYDHKDENGVLQPGGAILKSGLTKDMYDKVGQKGDYYDVTEINGKRLSETGVVKLNEEGTAHIFVDGMGADTGKRNPSCFNRFLGLQQPIDKCRAPFEQAINDEWDFYTSVRFKPSFLHQLDKNDAEAYNAFLDNVRNDVKTAMPELIMGKTFDETKYSQIMYTVSRRGAADVTATFQTLYDRFYK